MIISVKLIAAAVVLGICGVSQGEYEVKKVETITGRRPAEAQIETAGDQRVQEITHPPITREYVHSIRGKLKGKGLLKALMEDRTNERASEEIKKNR